MKQENSEQWLFILSSSSTAEELLESRSLLFFLEHLKSAVDILVSTPYYFNFFLPNQNFSKGIICK